MSTEDLKDIRKKILLQIDRIDSAQSLFYIQKDIISEIIKAEEANKQNKHVDFIKHIKQLRIYVDGLCWKFLHPHVIRQLNKNSSPVQALINQEGFDNTLATAEKYAKQGVPVVIADITNCIKIGDVILCGDPEHPRIIECKSGKPIKSNLNQGRTLRQISRTTGTLEYLQNGKAKVIGEDKTRVMIEVEAETQYNWSDVQQVVDEVLNGKEFSFRLINENELVYAFRNEEEVESRVLQYLMDLEQKYEIPVIGCHLTPMENLSITIPPPTFWPITFEARFALVEGEIVLIHIVDAAAFTKIESHEGSIKEILFEDGNLSDYCFSVKIKDKEFQLSARFLDDVVYGYATIESISSQIMEFALGSLQINEKNVLMNEEAIGEKPEVLFYNSLQQAVEDLENHQNGKKKFLVLPESAFPDTTKVISSFLLSFTVSEEAKYMAGDGSEMYYVWTIY